MCLSYFIKEEVASIRCVSFRQVSFDNVETELDRLTESYEEVVIDTFGGDCLLAIALYRYATRKKLDLISMDIEKGFIYRWLDAGVEKRSVQCPVLSIEQIIALHGGKIIRSKQHHIPEGYFPAIKKIAKYALRYSHKWTKASQFFSIAPTQHLIAETAKSIDYNGRRYGFPKEIATMLQEARMLEILEEDTERVCFSYPSQDAQLFCRSKGYILEVYLYILAMESGLFDECHIGMEIDWNGIFPEADNVQNEIDLVLRKGRKHIFISCKMTDLTAEAINELEVYAEHFLGKDCIKILVCTEKISPVYYNRCQEYGVLLIGLNEVERFIVLLKRHLKTVN